MYYYNNSTEPLDIGTPCAFDFTSAEGDSTALKSPLNTHLSLIVFEIICCVLGIPLNIAVTSSVLSSNRMCRKSRNIFLLGVILSNFCAFLRSILDIYYFFCPSDLTCKVYIYFSALPDAFLLLNSFFSLVDRYVAIGYPLWHRAKVTVPIVISLTLFGNLLQILILKFMYIFQLVPLRAQMRPLENVISLWSLGVPFVLCLVARLTVYFQTKRILAESYAARTDCDLVESVVMYSFNDSGTRASVRIQLGPRISQKMLNRLEVEATKVLVMGVTSLLLLSFPQLSFVIGINVCYNHATIDYCNDTYGWLSPYLKQFIQIHGVYHPIIYMAWNEEFSSKRSRCIYCR